jgi:23S rRNA pseudoU1915 N3-methylase RlmH
MLLFIAGILGYLITGPPPKWDKTWVNPTDESAARLDEKIETLEIQIDEADEGDELILELTEEEVTSKMHQLARDGNLSVDMEHPQIYFSEGLVQSLARVGLQIDVWVAIETTIGVKEGRPDIKIESLHFGRLPIPKTLVNSVVTALERATEERWDELDVTLQEVIIEQGEMNIILVKKRISAEHRPQTSSPSHLLHQLSGFAELV